MRSLLSVVAAKAPAILGVAAIGAATSESPDASRSPNALPSRQRDVEFFESEVRPLLAEHCFRCHGPEVERVKGGLRMRGTQSLLDGGESGAAIIAGDARASLFVRAIGYEDPHLQMPPTGPLSDDQVATLTTWIEDGAPWPEYEGLEMSARDERGIDLESGREWWSFRPLQRPEIPRVDAVEQPSNPIDAFVLGKLEQAGLTPNGPADPRTLLIRAGYGLTGLAPSLEEIEGLEAASRDAADEAWARTVDELLDRPEYGERQARLWLDLVRFAQTDGYERDAEKPFAWRYRDYVIEAFNADKPYDRFLREQLAGDELDQVTRDSLIATGFYRIGPWDDEPADERQAIFDDHDDVLRTISEGFLGVTVHCARCHDHKFDPFRQEDYYGLLALIDNVRPFETPRFDLDSPTLIPLDATNQSLRDWKAARVAAMERNKKELAALYASVRRRIVVERAAELSTEIQRIVAIPFRQRSDAEIDLLKRHPELRPSLKEVRAAFTQEESDLARDLTSEETNLKSSFEGDLEWTLGVREFGTEPAPTHLLVRGQAATPGQRVEPHFVPVLVENDDAARPHLELPDPEARTSGRRRALADWIASASNPLTARVYVNRVWQQHFGTGLVPTPNDFGAAGLTPTHPELLDWLASEFIARGWSTKELHRLILTSRTYRMSSEASNADARAADPGASLRWRQAMRRLDAEAVRDAMLAAGGILSEVRGGRGFFPRLPREAMAGASRPGEGWGKDSAEARSRRSIYAFIKRSMLAPMFETFDYTSASLPIGKRGTTTIVSQALLLLNSEFSRRCSKALASRVTREVGKDREARIERAFELVLLRAPSESERRIALRYVEDVEQDFRTAPQPLVFRQDVPARLSADFLAQLDGADLLLGPRNQWRYLKGAWGQPYNATEVLDVERGPAALLAESEFTEVLFEATLAFERGCEVASLLLRARPLEGAPDLWSGIEVAFEPEESRVSVRLVGPPEGEVLELGRAPVEAAGSYRVRIAVEGTSLSLRLGRTEEPVLVVDISDAPRSGRFGVRAVGTGFALTDAAIETRGERRELSPDAPGASEDRAFESYCLLLMNLNEFLYVD